MNLIKQLDELAFGTRLRLLTERVQQDAAKVYRSLNVDFEPRFFALFYLLTERAPVAITEAAAMLGYTQPAITQTANIMVKKGLVRIVKEKSDTRKRLLALTEKGNRLVETLKPVWKAFEDSTAELFRDTGIDVMMVFDKLERELNKKDLYSRISEKLKVNQSEHVRIIEYKPEHKNAFKELNYEWLNKYFRIENEDRRVLNNPDKSILKDGGYIFFGELDNEIVGTTALINHGKRTYEIAKMAVTEKAQGKQIGKKLALTAIEKAKTKKARTIFLKTNRRLTSALNLYRSLGFEQVEFSGPSKLERQTIKMELRLN